MSNKDARSHEHIKCRNAVAFGGSAQEKLVELEHRIEYGKRQFVIFQTYAMLVQAEIISGAYKLRDTAQGRKVTPEEEARGEIIGWRKHTDEEKLQHTINTMKAHIQHMSDANDSIDSNRREMQKVLDSINNVHVEQGAKIGDNRG